MLTSIDSTHIEINHIEFVRVDCALSFWDKNGGHLFVERDTGSSIWFSPRWTASEIFKAPVLTGRDGVLNPAKSEIQRRAALQNPHKKGTLAHNRFDSFYGSMNWLSSSALRRRYQKIRSKAQDFLNLSSSQMSDLDFEADVAAKIFQHKFGFPIPEARPDAE